MNPAAEAIQQAALSFRRVESPSALRHALRTVLAHKVVGVDTEGTGLDPLTDRVRLIQLATSDSTFVIDLDRVGDPSPLLTLFESDNIIKVFHHGKFDLSFLSRLLAPERPVGAFCKGLFDTMIASLLLDPHAESHSLAALCERHLGIKLDKTEQTSDFSGDLSDGQLAYAAKDAAVLLPLRRILRQRLIDEKLVRVAKLEFDLVPVIADMELAGIYLDLDMWETVWSKMREERERLAEVVSHSLGRYLPGTLFGAEAFHPDSNQQVLEALRGMGLDLPHTGESLLKPLAAEHPPIADLLAYRAVAKAVTSCGDPIPHHVHPRTGRIHAQYRQIGASTGRMSCRSPNIQQIPRRSDVRACFRAPEGRRLIVADYSQIELRVAAALASDQRMIHAYRRGEDLHRLTASLISGVPQESVDAAGRQAAKAVNFGLLFAMGAKGLATYAKQQYGVELSLEEAESFRTRFFQAYTGLRAWHDEARRLVQDARHKPVEVRTVAGRIFRFHGNASLSWFLNSPVQGSAAEVMKRAMVRVHHALTSFTNARIIGVVHDELLVETAATDAVEAVEVVRREMETAGAEFFPQVPFVADAAVVSDWGEKS